MRELLESLEQLFKPVDGWGEFRKGARPAAVTFILYRQADRWMVPFVRRRADMRDHPGQVALPGGGVKPGESAWEAAQREVAEEIGVPVGRMVPLGAGDPIYAAVTNFSVVPFVAYLPGPVESFVHDERELEGVLAIPLDRLLDDSAWLESDSPWRFRYLAHEESVVWGLTERIVYGLAPKLRQALAADRSSDQPAAER
ncbi:MAG: CoA pyrophosphatase [Chloroflexi bacterium]|nr:MAG: CoA pyrophosphatase [Chloroflexota bacterium]TMG23300.1 MAG: CoA pyrophosphatase [Chloroflexota bacterium]